MKRINLIDFLRGYSIFTIVAMHLCQGYVSGALNKALSFGGAGVHLFILCSGLGLYLSYLRNPVEYGDFLRRRFGKVWTPYAIAVVLWGIWYLASKGFFPIREVASHLLLYKMFSTELDTSLCYPYWFISTIVQFYLFWPLIVKVYRMKWGIFLFLAISLIWSTVVGVLGLEDKRPWGSFCLQYLWEFGLGMWIAERMIHGYGEKYMDSSGLKWWWWLLGAVGGMGVSALMAWNGGILKLYNDIPSLIGYLSVALLIYKIGIKFVNKFFIWASSFSYELYLVHSLVYGVITYLLSTYLSVSVSLVPIFLLLQLFAAYALAYGYRCLLSKSKIT